jgi:hypothetical protein
MSHGSPRTVLVAWMSGQPFHTSGFPIHAIVHSMFSARQAPMRTNREALPYLEKDEATSLPFGAGR